MRIAPVSHHGRHPSGANVQVNALHHISNNEQNSLRVGKNNVNTVAMETPLMLHVNDPEPLTLSFTAQMLLNIDAAALCCRSDCIRWLIDATAGSVCTDTTGGSGISAELFLSLCLHA